MAKQVRCWLVLLVMLCAAPGTADDLGQDVPVPVRPEHGGLNNAQLAPEEDRIAELERTVKVLANELERERSARAFPEEAPLASEWGLGPAASKVYNVGQGISIGGYGEIYYSKLIGDSGDKKDRADALRTVLYVGYKFTDSIIFNSEFEFEHATTGSTESSSGGSVSAEFAALDFLWKDWANFRAGLLLVPMGFINEIHEPPSYFGTHRPEVERQIIPSTWREIGTGVFGTLCDEDVQYSMMYVINALNGKGFRSSGLRGGRQKGNRALAEHVAFVGRVDWTPIEELTVGGSVYHGNSGQHQEFTMKPSGMPQFNVGIPTTPTTIWEAHAQYVNRGWWLRGLFTMAHVGDNGALTRALAPVSEGGIGELKSGEGIGGMMLGVYGEVYYDILPSIFPGTEKSLQPFVRVEYYDTQLDMPAGYVKDSAKEITIFTAGFSYKPIPNVVIKADYRNRSAAHGEIPDELNMGVGFAF